MTVVELYETCGWIQGRLAENAKHESHTDPQSREAVAFCVSGAIINVYGWDWETRGDAVRRLDTVIRDRYPEYGPPEWPDDFCVVDWNNTPGRTKEEVVEVCKLAQI